MIRRALEKHLRGQARRYPVVTLTGPRQSGKTTLARSVFKGKPYVSLEAPDLREYALSDPRGFLAEHAQGAIFDEIQRAPALLSYLQQMVDEDPKPGRFVLTGSQNLAMHREVSQSLAGRTALSTLLPLSREEVERFDDHPKRLFDSLVLGSYPPVFDRKLPPMEWYGDYVATYVERDVRQLLGVTDLAMFQRFLRLAAARTGQLLNVSSLASDAGITSHTAAAWLGVLEASFLCVRLPAYHRNVGKRAVKAPKLHFLDSGLLCYLLGIRRAEQLRLHPLRGAVFESWVVSEIFKARFARGASSDVFYYRDRHGSEVDVVVEADGRAMLVEVKSGETVSADAFRELELGASILGPAVSPSVVEKVLLYGGTQKQQRMGTRVTPWQSVQQLDWVAEAP